MADKILTFNGKSISGPSGTGIVMIRVPEPTLPPMTLRFQFSNPNYDPTEESFSHNFQGNWTQVESQYNQWDWTCESDNWGSIFSDAFTDTENLVSIIDAGDTSSVTNTSTMFERCSSLISIVLFDTSNVTYMTSMFIGCSSLETVPLFNTSNVTEMLYMFTDCSSLENVPLFDTSNVTNMYAMFQNCTSLETVPLFDTSNVTDMSYMFDSCYNVEHGALALYQQASSQQNPPSNYQACFDNCGANTQTGIDELYEIPSSWGGWGS